MLLLANTLCYFLVATFSASISIFSMSLLGLQLQPEQPQLVTSSRSFSLLILVHSNFYLFLFFQLNPFVPRHNNINQVTLSSSFAQGNYIRSSLLNDMIYLDIKISQYFDPVILWFLWFLWFLSCLWLYHLISSTKLNFWHSSKCTILAI